MICECLCSEGYDHHSLYTDLPDAFNSFGSEKPSKAHGETWRNALLIWSFLSEVKSHSVLDEKMMFFFWSANFEDIGGGVEIVYIWNPKWSVSYLSPINICNSATMAATSSEVNLTLVLTLSVLSLTYSFCIIKDYWLQLATTSA